MRLGLGVAFSVFLCSLSAPHAIAQTSIQYSSYLGGPGSDSANAVAVGPEGATYVAIGFTKPGDDVDVKVVKFAPFSRAVVFSTLVGGSSSDTPMSIAVGPDGSAWVAGTTSSANFPLVNPLQTGSASGSAFLFRLSPDGTTLAFSTLLAPSAAGA